MACKLGIDILGWVRMSIISSVNNANLNSLPRTEISRIFEFPRMDAARGSTHSANNGGESGHPWRVPFAIRKVGDRAKGVLTWDVGLVYKCWMACRKGPRNPMCLSVANRKGQPKRSKAFSESSPRARDAWPSLFATSIKSMTCLVLSPTWWKGTKPTWSLCIKDGNITFRCNDKSFVKNF